MSFWATLAGPNRFTGQQNIVARFEAERDFCVSGAITPTQITANQNDYNVDKLKLVSRLRLSTDASRNMTGLVGGYEGRILIIHNVGSFDLVLKNQDLNSSAQNRFLFGSDLTVGADHSAALWYDGVSSRWRLFSIGFAPVSTLIFAAGTYTPTLTNAANLASSTAAELQYSRVGATVSVSGKATVELVSAGALTQLGISLPIASNFGAVEDCGGVAFMTDVAGDGAGIIGDAANNRAEMKWVAGLSGSQPMSLQFQYQMI